MSYVPPPQRPPLAAYVGFVVGIILLAVSAPPTVWEVFVKGHGAEVGMEDMPPMWIPGPVQQSGILIALALLFFSGLILFGDRDEL